MDESFPTRYFMVDRIAIEIGCTRKTVTRHLDQGCCGITPNVAAMIGTKYRYISVAEHDIPTMRECINRSKAAGTKRARAVHLANVSQRRAERRQA